MRAWRIVGKYPVFDDFGEVSRTDITLVSDSSGYATFTESLLGDHRSKSDKELIELAHEAYFKSEYADRAMAESVQTVEELKRQSEAFAQGIEEAKAEIASLKEETLNEIKVETEKNREMVRIVTLTVNEVLAQLMEGADDESSDTIEDIIEE